MIQLWPLYWIFSSRGTINCPSGTQADASSEQVKQHSACLQALKSFISAENEASRWQSAAVEGSFHSSLIKDEQFVTFFSFTL